jgi:hypothetical protein
MTEWTRFRHTVCCGGCGVRFPPQHPVRVIRIAGVKHEFIRCEACADDEAPNEVPEHELLPRPARVNVAFVPELAARMPYKDER